MSATHDKVAAGGVAMHTPGPWRWEFSASQKNVQLVGGLRPQFDLTVMDFIRWGMGGAGIRLRDTSEAGMDLLDKLQDRSDWLAPFPGREHHARWLMNVTHPDMVLIAAAPDLLVALQALLAEVNVRIDDPRCATFDAARAAIAKATASPTAPEALKD